MPGGGGRCLPMMPNSWPMKPSGVQLAKPTRPPGRTTRAISRAAVSWFGVNMMPKVERAASKLLSANGSASASATWNVTGRRSEAARRGERGVAVAGGDVEDALAGLDVDRLAQALADDLQRGADDRIVAGRPGRLLALLDGGVVGGGSALACHCGCAHGGFSFVVLRPQRPRGGGLVSMGGRAHE